MVYNSTTLDTYLDLVNKLNSFSKINCFLLRKGYLVPLGQEGIKTQKQVIIALEQHSYSRYDTTCVNSNKPTRDDQETKQNKTDQKMEETKKGIFITSEL